MEEYEAEYNQEEPEAPETEGSEPEITELEETGSEETGSEEPDADPEEETEEEIGAESEETETDEPEADAEEGSEEETAEEVLEEEQETVSGNDIVIRGDAVIFPEEFDLTTLEGEPVDTASIVQAVEYQTNVIYVGFAGVSFLLGIIGGIVMIQGFRLRRV